MHLPNQQSDILTDLGSKLRGLTQELVKDLPQAHEPLQLGPTPDLFANQSPTTLLLLTEGQVHYLARGKLVNVIEPGDLLGLQRTLKLPSGTYTCDHAVTFQVYERDQLVAHVNRSPELQKHWTYYLLCAASYYREALSQEISTEFHPSAGFMHFRAGETIIHQGAEADRVYTLLEGSAEAVRDGVKVGDIHPDEIFGALAVFTRQKRMASVIASSDCTVLAVRKEEFVALIEHQPKVCLGLIEEMAEKINQLNGQLSASAGESFAKA